MNQQPAAREHCTCLGERPVRITVDNRGKAHEQCKRCNKRVKQEERIEFVYERVTA